MLKLNIGCGPDIRDGWDNIDKWKFDDRVVPVDLELGKLPYSDNSVDEIRATHVLEHVQNLIPLMNECWRVLKDDGFMYVEVPRFPHLDSVKDPDHKRFFVLETFTGYFSLYLKQGMFNMYNIKAWNIKQINMSTSESTICTTLTPYRGPIPSPTSDW